MRLGRASIAHRTRAGVALVAALLIAAITAEGQELEPRAFANTPVGLNFLILGYGYTTGDVSLDTSVPIEDGKIKVHSAFLAYARSLDAWGRNAKLDLVLPYAWLSGSAKVAGKRVDREVSGLGDPQARLSLLFYGAPALTLGRRSLVKLPLAVEAEGRWNAEVRTLRLRMLHRWLDNWRGIGDVVAGMAREEYDLELRRYNGRGWRAVVLPEWF